jgi:uncharacterized protein YkwD
MDMSLYPQRRRGRGVLPFVGWLLLVGLGAGLAWYGFVWSERGEPPPGTPSPASASGTSPQPTPPPPPTVTSAPAPTEIPVPEATLAPAPVPATAIPPTPYVVAGVDGVNVRTGPGTDHTRLGYLDPGAEAPLVDGSGDWWQIRYEGALAWVFAELVTAFNVDQAAPPPATVPAATVPPSATPPPPTQTPSVEEAVWPAEVFQLINAVRAENGLPPYTYNETLEQAAQLHGQDCQQRGSCSHAGSDGSNVQIRILRAGYDAAGWAEVLVYSTSPQAAVDWWMDETPPDDPHRSTLLSTWVTEVGIAVVPTGRGDYYFIAVFGRPKTL